MDILLIQNGVVMNMISADSVEQAKQFYPDFTCIQNPEAFVVGDLYDGFNFTHVPHIDINQIKHDCVEAILEFMDSIAAQHGFYDMVDAMTYIDSTIPQLQTESAKLKHWRDQCWAYCYQELGKLISGNRAVPIPAQFINELPPIG